MVLYVLCQKLQVAVLFHLPIFILVGVSGMEWTYGRVWIFDKAL